MSLTDHWKYLHHNIVDLYKNRNLELVTALRSDNYSQGRGKLRKNDKFCCLGVACDLTAIKLGLVIDSVEGAYWYNGEESYVPIEVAAYYGWADTEPDLILSDRERMPASYVNDTLALPFDEIADAFQRTYVDVDVED